MKTKKNIAVLLCLIVSLGLYSFQKAIPKNEKGNLSYTKDVTDEYEEVLAELDSLRLELEASMTEEEKVATTPLLVLAAQAAAAVRATVAVVRVTAALTRTAQQVLVLLNNAAMTAGGTLNLLKTMLTGLNSTQLNNSLVQEEIDEMNLFLLQ